MRRWALIGLVGCAAPPPQRPDAPQADLALTRVTVRSWEGARLKLLATADSLEVFREGASSGFFMAHDAGVTVMSDGLTLVAPSVQGNFVEGRFGGDAGVRAWRAGFFLEARAFEADLDAQHISFEDAQTRFVR